MVRVAYRFIPKREARMLNEANFEKIMDHLVEVQRLEIEHDTSKRRRDDNFLKLLEVLKYVAVYLGEEDPYYDLWIGLFIKTAARVHRETLEGYMANFRGKLMMQGVAEGYEDLSFKPRAYYLRTCGGLQLIEEEYYNG